MKHHDQDRTHPDNRPAEQAGTLPTGPLTSVDDPRLTAYALGELEGVDVDAKQRVEEFLANSPDAREAVIEIQSLSEVVTQGLVAELREGRPSGVGDVDSPPGLGLTPEQRELVLQSASAPTFESTRGLLPRLLPWVPAMAAGLLATWIITRMEGSEPGLGSSATDSGLAAALATESASASSLDADEKRFGGRAGDSLLDRNARGSLDQAAEEIPDLEDRARLPEAGRKRGRDDQPVGAPRHQRLEPSEDSEASIVEPVLQDAEVGDPTDAGREFNARSRDKSVDPTRSSPSTDPVLFDDLERWSDVLERKPHSRALFPDSPSPGSPSPGSPSPRSASPEPEFARSPERRRERESRSGEDQDPKTVERELYQQPEETPVRSVALEPLSTFSVDVDTASYSNVRRFLDNRQLPPPAAVRIEEMVNYFDYDYPPPTGADPFSVSVEIADCPWAEERRLVRIGLQAQEPPRRTRFDANSVVGATNLVFLLDVSGSMDTPNKLPLLKKGMRMLVENLNGVDTVSIAVYAGTSGLVLPPTPGIARERIFRAIDNLEAGGSTAGGAGIELAYRLAAENFIPRGTNRVILGTDGDFNVGVSSVEELAELAAEKAKSDIFLTVLGFGTGNLQDTKLETLANRGNGHYAYIDSEKEAHKVLVREIGSTLHTVAKDVKFQVEFNPLEVREYRLLGYENRRLANHEFEDDTVDAGEIGAGHRVTALYEITPGVVTFEDQETWKGTPDLRYKRSPLDNSLDPNAPVYSGELLNVSLRYKEPDEDESKLIEVAVFDLGQPWTDASEDFRFAAAVAGFGLVLSDSLHVGTLNLDLVRELASEGAGPDPYGYRAEFLRLVDLAKDLMDR